MAGLHYSPFSHVSQTRIDADLINMTTPETEAQKQRLKKLYIGLVLGGLAVGGLMSIGVVFALQRLGLTQPPSQEQVR